MKLSRFGVGTAILFSALGFCVHKSQAWQSDNGDGTFSNPVMYADNPDPDIVRVTNDFYMASTTFANPRIYYATNAAEPSGSSD